MLQEVSSGPVKGALNRLTKCFLDKSKRSPNFKSYRDKKQSFDMDYCMTHVNDNQIRIPGSKGQAAIWLRMHGNNHYADNVFKRATIHRDWDRYYVTLLYEVDSAKVDNGQRFSLFRNVDSFTTFNGMHATIVGHPNVDRLEKKLKGLRRKLSGQQRLSNRYARTTRRIRRLSARISNVYKNFYHHWSKALANSQVFVDSLNAKGMSESSSSELNRLVRQARWAQFQHMLGYKAFALHEVAPENITLTCSRCGKAGHREGDVFYCADCNLERHADSNAAMNILDGAAVFNGEGGLRHTRM